MNNLLELFTTTERLGELFVNTEIIKTVLLLIFWCILTFISGAFISHYNNTLQVLYKHREENKKAIGQYSLIFIICIICFIFSVYKNINNIFYLIECCVNPNYIYLKHLITLMR